MKNIILIYRFFCGIGDYVCLTGYINCLKRQYPNKKIFLVTGVEDVFLNNPKFEKIFIIRSLFLQKILLKIFPIFKKIGFPIFSFEYNNNVKGMEEYIIKNPEEHYIKVNGKHIIDRLDFIELHNEIYLTRGEIEQFEKKFMDLPLKFALIHSEGVTSYTPNKEIGSDRFQKIVDKNNGINWVQIGLSTNKYLSNTIDYRGRTTLRELFYIFSKASFVVCQEGVNNHIANAFDIPSITIFTGFNPSKLCSYNSTVIIQNERLPECSPCMRTKKCEYNMMCNDYDIEGEVMNAIIKIEMKNSGN